MIRPEIYAAPLLRAHTQRILPYCGQRRLPGPAFRFLCVMSSTRARMPVAVVLFSLN